MHGVTPRTVLCHGVFDQLHLGHIRHLKEAREQGDRLVVSVTADHFVNKGLGRPFFTAAQRVEALLALDCVDDAFVSDYPTATGVIQKIRPDVYVKGIDYAGNDNPFHAQDCIEVEKYGGKVYITQAEKFSSSRILNRERLGDAVAAYLAGIRDRGFLKKIKHAFKKADQLAIAFVGERIIDEYRYVGSLAKPSKEFILATVERSKERFRGGIEAAAAHADWKTVRIVSVADAITKTRFVDADFNRKLLEVYSATEVQVPPTAAFFDNLSAAARECDLVIVMDFGHGLIDVVARQALKGSKFLAVNAQTNAGNAGFNLVSKYRHPHLVCVDEPEARLALLEKDLKANLLVEQLRNDLTAQNAIITRGRNGAVTCNGAVHEIPAFATLGIDTIGAGDAFLAVVGPLVCAGLDLEAAAFVGNVAGAIKTTIVGHRRHVTRDEILQNVEALLA